MENILDLIYKLLFEIEDPESKLLYIQLIKTHPEYKYMCDQPIVDNKSFVPLYKLLNIINTCDIYNNTIFPIKFLERRGWREWFESLTLQYEKIIKTST